MGIRLYNLPEKSKGQFCPTIESRVDLGLRNLVLGRIYHEGSKTILITGFTVRVSTFCVLIYPYTNS